MGKLKISSHGLKMLMNLEGVKSDVYKDIAGIPTIGVGHVLSKSERSSGKITLSSGETLDFRNGLSHAQIMSLLLDDVQQYEDAVSRNVKLPLESHQFDALTSLVFNIGEKAFERSTLLKMLNKSMLEAIPDEFRKWNKANVGGRKVVIKGLVNRREVEVAAWLGQNPSGNLDHEQPRPDEYTPDDTEIQGTSLVPAGELQTDIPSVEMMEFRAWKQEQENSKPTLQSKIIGTAGALVASALLTRYGLDLPPETVADVITWVTVGGGALIAYFRKFKTEKASLR